MKNVKDEVYAALLNVTENVSDSYPQKWEKGLTILYAEEENKVTERIGNQERMARVRYRIDIFDKKSTSLAAIAVDDELSRLGLVRTGCSDVEDPSAWKHKQMRYEGIIDMESDIVYWDF